MIASHHGYNIDLAGLRSKYSVSLKGSTLNDLIRIAGELRLQSRSLRLDLDELESLQTPCVLHWDLCHFVVYSGVSRGRHEIRDPALGRRLLKLEEIGKHFTGVAVEMTPAIDFERQDVRQSLKLMRIFKRVVGIKRSLGQVFLLALSLEIFAVLMPMFSQWIIDDALVLGDLDLLKIVIVGLLFVGVTRIGLELIRSWIVMHFTTTLACGLTESVFSHLLRLPVAWFEKRHIGDIVSRFGSLSSIQQALTGRVVGALLDGIMASVTLGVIVLYSGLMTMLVLLAVASYALVRILRYGVLRDANAEQLILQARQQTHFIESVRSIQAIKLFNREDDRCRRYSKIFIDAINNGLNIQKQSMAFSACHGFIVTAENAAILYIGASLVLSGQFSVGMLVAFLSYKDQFISRISSLIDTAVSLRMLRIQTDRLADIVLADTELDSRAHESSELAPTIEVRNLSFRYSSGEPWVLRNVSMKVEAGECVAISGPSGCGKTTLLKIMLGQLQPTEGEVLIGGIPLPRVGVTGLRAHAGVVMQEDNLLAGSLSENISFFDSPVQQSRVEACAKLASIHGDIVRMPMGYNTLAGESWCGLSGGQKQRVLLARALYKQSRMLFLDEATSHLDIRTEHLINHALKRLRMTRVIIAHRPSTLEIADRVIVIPDLKSSGAAPAKTSFEMQPFVAQQT
jgi:ATP-binding cassette subfamily B protein RaxB